MLGAILGATPGIGGKPKSQPEFSERFSSKLACPARQKYSSHGCRCVAVVFMVYDLVLVGVVIMNLVFARALGSQSTYTCWLFVFPLFLVTETQLC